MGIEKEHKWLSKFNFEGGEFVPNLRAERELLPWQALAVKFLHFCRKHYGYALLADEMGVGKVIFYLCWVGVY